MTLLDIEICSYIANILVVVAHVFETRFNRRDYKERSMYGTLVNSGFMITLRACSIPHHVAHRPETSIGQTYVSLPVHLSAHAGCGNVKYLGSARGSGRGFGV